MTCTQCGFENDPTRVFCQNCGTRLPVAAAPAGKLFIPPEQQVAKGARKPIKPVRVPSSGSVRKISGGRLMCSFVFTIIFAAFLAAVIQMLRTPDAIPPPFVANDSAAAAFYQSIKTAASSPYPRVSQVSQNQANNYLAATLTTAPDDGGGIRARFSRAFVIFGEGDYRFVVEEKVLNWPIYLYLTQQPVSAGGSVTVNTTGGGVGRMPFDPRLISLVGHFVNPVTAALTEATDLLQKASGAAITPTQASVNWPGVPASR